MTAADEAITTDVASKTFRLVRKGYDPHEVRRYLSRLADEISVLRTRAEAPGAPDAGPAAPTPEGASPPLAESPAGDSSSSDAGTAPVEAPDAADGPGAAADVPAAEAAPAATVVDDADPPAAPADPPATDPLATDPLATDPPSAGAGDDAGTGDRWAQMGRHVASVLAVAEREAAAVKANAEQLAAERLAAVDGEVEISRAALREVRRQLTEVHTLVGRSLGQFPPGPSDEPPATDIGGEAPSLGAIGVEQPS